MKKLLVGLLIILMSLIPLAAYGQTYTFEVQLGELATVTARFDSPEKLDSMFFSLCDENFIKLHTFGKGFAEYENSQEDVVLQWDVPKYFVEGATQACDIRFYIYSQPITIESAPLTYMESSAPTPTRTQTPAPTATPTATQTPTPTSTALAQPNNVYVPFLKR